MLSTANMFLLGFVLYGSNMLLLMFLQALLGGPDYSVRSRGEDGQRHRADQPGPQHRAVRESPP